MSIVDNKVKLVKATKWKVGLQDEHVCIQEYYMKVSSESYAINYHLHMTTYML